MQTLAWQLRRRVLWLGLGASLLAADATAAAYRLLLETDADSGPGTEVYVTSFATFGDLIASPPSGGPGAFSGININSAYGVRGLAYDGMYRLLLETDADSGSGTEVYITSFATFDELIASPPSGGPGAFSGININSAYSIGGFAYEFDPAAPPPPPTGVPAPATGALMLLGCSLLALARRWRAPSPGR